jgi:O-antigen/teichoic acid export membrane protein
MNSDVTQLKQILKGTLPYALLSFLMTIYFRLDSVLINWLNGAEENGVYAAAYRLLDMSIMFSYLFAALLLPMFTRLISEKKSVHELTGISSRLLIPASCLLPLCFLFYKMDLFELFYHHQNEYASLVMAIVMCSFPFISAMYIFGTLVTANGNIGWLNKAAFITMLLNLLLNVYLIPHYHALGAACAALTSHAFMSIATTIKAFQLFNFKIRKKEYFALGIFCVISLVLFGISNYLPFNHWIMLTISLLISICFIFLLRIIPIEKGILFLKELTNRATA